MAAGQSSNRARRHHGHRQGRAGAGRGRTPADHHRSRAFRRLRAAHLSWTGRAIQRGDGRRRADRGGVSGPTLQRQPALCWKYLAEIGRACLRAEPNAGHFAIAEWQRQRPGTWLLTQNIDGFHRRAGSPPERLIEIHGELAPLSCMACGEIDRRPLASLLDEPLPPRCEVCTGVLRPAVVLFEEMLPERALARLQEQSRIGFDAVLVVGTTASFGYILEPTWRARQSGGLVVEVNLQPTDISPLANLSLQGRAADVLSHLLRHISSD